MSTINHNSPILFLAQTLLYTLLKRSPLKCKILRFSSARVKTPHVNFELTSQFLFKFCIILHCHDTKFPCKFSARTFSNLDKRTPSKSQFLDFWACSRENLLNSYVIFESTSRFPFKFCINIQCHQTWLFCIFLAPTLYTLVKRSQLKCIFLRFSSARIKICQIPHVNFEMEVNSVSNFESFFIAMTHNSPVSFKFINFQL